MTERRVGPVLQEGAATEPVLRALHDLNPELVLFHRGAYVRVLAPSPCRLTRGAVERHGGRLALPGDLEAIMFSFSGRISIEPDAVTWWEEDLHE